MLSRLLVCVSLLGLICTPGWQVSLGTERPTPGSTIHAAPASDPLLAASPNRIVSPTWGKPGTQKDITVTLENARNTSVTLSAVELHEDSTKPSGLPTNWLGFTGAMAGTVINETSTLATTVQLNKDGVIIGSPRQLWGHITFRYLTPEPGSLVLPIEYTVADTIKFPVWDTLATACTKLAVSCNGNSGKSGSWGNGGANMDYAGTALECDTGSNSRGNARIYLYDGSPVIIRKTGESSFTASWSIFSDFIGTDHVFKPLPGFAPTQKITSNLQYDQYNSGTFCSSDSLVKVEKIWYAPKGMADSCKFILQKTMFFPYTIDQAVTGLAIGEAVDWEVPSDDYLGGNVGGFDPTRNLVYMRGYEKADDTIDCRDNSVRYAGLGLLATRMKNGTCDSILYAGYNAANDSFVYPEGTFVPKQLWNNMGIPGMRTESRMTDLHSVLSYRHGAAMDQGWTLPANDTLTVWSVLITIPNAATTIAGLDSLKAQYNRAKAFYMRHFAICTGICGCCIQATRGNVNQTGIIDISDVSLLVAYLTANPPPTLPCRAAANVNASPDGMIDISDLSWLIGWIMHNPQATLPPCGCP